MKRNEVTTYEKRAGGAWRELREPYIHPQEPMEF
jgi:hypothetical protein